MNELKTLEDIESYHGEYDKIRDLGIYWFNTLKGTGWEENTIADWIKHFFNLTEENLKENEE